MCTLRSPSTHLGQCTHMTLANIDIWTMLVFETDCPCPRGIDTRVVCNLTRRPTDSGYGQLSMSKHRQLLETIKGRGGGRQWRTNHGYYARLVCFRGYLFKALFYLVWSASLGVWMFTAGVYTLGVPNPCRLHGWR